MPVGFLTVAERTKLSRFPETLSDEDRIQYFTLTDDDLKQIPIWSAEHNRLGFGIQLGALRFLGYFPEDLYSTPSSIMAFIAQQLHLSCAELAGYGDREQTRSDHQRRIRIHLGFQLLTATDQKTLQDWLLQRALEHDKPTLLLHMLCERLHQQRIVRPGITSLERWIGRARQGAQNALYQRFKPFLTDTVKAQLDDLLVVDAGTARTPLAWLRQAALSNSPSAILNTLRKIEHCRHHGVAQWHSEITQISPNRLKSLSQIARRTTNQGLQRMAPTRRYPTLMAFLHQTLTEAIDECLDQFDRCLTDVESRAKNDLETFRQQVAKATNEKVGFFQALGQLILDQQIADAQLRQAIYQQIPPDILKAALAETDHIIRPKNDHALDFLAKRYSYLRRYVPLLLDTLNFQSNRQPHDLIKAIELLRQLNKQQRRGLPKSAPNSFITAKWLPYVFDPQGDMDRRYYELAVLWQLKALLRSGDLWVIGSRRYADPETYLIPSQQWPTLRAEVAQQLRLAQPFELRLSEREAELSIQLSRIDALLTNGQNAVRIEGDALILTPHSAQERPNSLQNLEKAISQRLPRIELSELLMEVDRWTGFSQYFDHAGGERSAQPDYLYAAVLAQGCNLGIERMTPITGLNAQHMTWTTQWHLRDTTLTAATNALVDFQYQQPLSQHWGGGTLSSSDGQRFPVAGHSTNATALPRYFGYGRGVTFYTWTSDQFSQFGTKVIPATVRDATYVLDEILGNETELDIVEHTTDTLGYTEIVFALFDLLGLQFSPRIRDLGEQRLYILDDAQHYPTLGRRLKGTLNHVLIASAFDQLVRVAGSMKLGYVTASLFISKLQAYPRQNPLAKALQEYGRLIKTLFILRYLESEALRRRINTQLNKGEALHALRRFLVFANEGIIRRKDSIGQQNQAQCLNLLTNAVVVWNTVYMQEAVNQLRKEGMVIEQDDLARLSPARYAHINPFGKYSFQLDLEPGQLRPLRKA